MPGLAEVAATYRFWGRHPFLYAAQDYVTFLGRPRMVRAASVGALACGPGDRVLEVGCGTGRNLPYLVRAVGRKAHVVGFDYSREMLDAAARLARARGWCQVEFVQGNAAALPVTGSFDGVLGVLAMSAIPDWQRARWSGGRSRIRCARWSPGLRRGQRHS